MSYDTAARDPHTGGKLTFDDWRKRLVMELAGAMRMTIVEARDYVRATGDDCWRESYDDGMSPREAADEEVYAGNS